MKQNAWIAGVGMTNFTKHADRTLKSLSIEAISEALKDADMTANQLEAAYMATAGTAVTVGQVMVPGQAALREMNIGGIPVVNVENACASAATSLLASLSLPMAPQRPPSRRHSTTGHRPIAASSRAPSRCSPAAERKRGARPRAPLSDARRPCTARKRR